MGNFLQMSYSNHLGLQISAAATESGEKIKGCSFGNGLTINLMKCGRSKNHVSDKNFSNSSKIYHMANGPQPSIIDTVKVKITLFQ